MPSDPFQLFDEWFAEARASEPNDPEAMALATATPDAIPSVRMVLLKGHGREGFSFYTNLDSRKGAELAANPRAALLFHWKSLRRQVRVRGLVSRTTDAEADAYFASRPRGSQIGAWASQQSSAVESRAALDAAEQQIRERFEGGDVPRPDFWGGFRLVPDAVEFWQGRINRLHDRLRYDLQVDGSWQVVRLSP